MGDSGTSAGMTKARDYSLKIFDNYFLFDPGMIVDKPDARTAGGLGMMQDERKKRNQLK